MSIKINTEKVIEQVVNPVKIPVEGENIPATDKELSEEVKQAREKFRKAFTYFKDFSDFSKLPVPLWYKEENPKLYGLEQAKENLNFNYALESSKTDNPEERAKLKIERYMKKEELENNLHGNYPGFILNEERPELDLGSPSIQNQIRQSETENNQEEENPRGESSGTNQETKTKED